jgi:hypothetical protein
MPQSDKNLHVFGELLAIFVLIPILFYLSFYQINFFNKILLYAIILVTLIIDGYLLYQYDKW